MTDAPLSRRTVLRSIAAGGALAASGVLLGCGVGSRGATSGGEAAGTLVMVIRHAEKVRKASPLRGVDERGQDDPSSLTPVGWDRARRLADVFAPVQGPVRPGLARPKVIYAAVGADEPADSTRTRETLEPLADRLGVKLDTSFGTGDEERLVKQVTAGPGPTLICWHHDEILTIASEFPSVNPTPPGQWPDDRYDVVWTFTRTSGGWQFDQVPELVLPQDRAAVIAG